MYIKQLYSKLNIDRHVHVVMLRGAQMDNQKGKTFFCNCTVIRVMTHETFFFLEIKYIQLTNIIKK